jgi:PAS domain S-box-containing protein
MTQQDKERALLGLQIDLVYRRTPFLFASATLLSAVLVAALWPLAQRWILLGWMLVLWGVVGVRLYYARRYVRLAGKGEVNPEKWHEGLVAGAAVTGMCWGFSVLGISSSPLEPSAMLLMLAIAGVAANASTSLAAAPMVAPAFLLAALLPPMLWVLSFGGRLNFFVGGIILLYLGLLMLLSRQTLNTVRGWLLATERNKALEDDARVRQQEHAAGLRESELRMRRYFEHAPGLFATIVQKPDGSYAMPFVSEGIRELFGLEPEAVMNDIGEFVARTHPDDVAMTFAKTVESARELTTYHVEYRIIHPQKGMRWIEVSGQPQRLPDGGVRWDGFYHDITVRKQMEETLAVREREFRQQAKLQESLLSGLRDAGIMLIAVENGKFVYTNDHYVGCQLGYEEGALPANVDFIELIHPDDRSRIAAMHRDRLAGKPVPISYEIGALGGDGLRREYEFHVTRVPDTDPPQTLLLTLRIDERKRTETELLRREREFRALAENSPDPIYRYDRDGRRLYANSMACKLGGKSEAELIGRRFIDDSVLLPEQRPKLLEAVQRVFDCGEGSQLDLGFILGNGDYRDYQMRLVPERDAFEQVVSVLAIARDITELKDVQRRTEQFVANFPGFVYSFRMTPDGRSSFPFASPGIEKLYGLQPSDVTDDSAALHALAHPDDALGIVAALVESARTMTPLQHEFRICRPDLPERWTEFRSSPVREADGSIVWHGIMVDIDGRKRMESELVLREQEYRSLTENLPDNIARMDAAGRVLYSNPIHQRSLGKSSAEMIGKTYGELFPDGRYTPVEQAIAQVLATGQPTQFVRQPVPSENGETRIHDVRLVPEFDEHGRVISVLGMGRDMTEVYRLQEAITAREQEFRSLAESSPDSIIRYDLEHRILYLNSLLARELQLASADEVLGKRPSEVWPDGRFAVIDAAAQRVIASGDMENIELVWPQEDGTVRYGQITVVPERDAGGQIIGTLAFGRNITSIRETERRLSNLVENLPGIAYTFRLSPDGGMSFPYVSAGVEDIYGLKPEEAMIDYMAIHGLAHSDDRPRIEAGIAESARTMTPYRVESRVCRPGHVERWLDVRAVPRLEPDGSMFWDGVMLDITERKWLEEDLKLKECVLDQAHDGVYLIDEYARFVYVNDEACRALGYSREELLGMRVQDIDYAYAVEDTQAVGEKSRLEGAFAFETQHRKRDGSLFPVEIMASALEYRGKHLGLALARDITERKRIEQALAVREQEFRTLAENSPDVIVRYDRELRRVYINPAWETANGLSVGDALGKRPSEIAAVVSTSVREFEERLRGVLERGEPEEIEFGGKDRSGNMKYFSMRVVPERDEHGAVAGLLTMANDITERKRIENELRHNREMLADAQKLALLGSWDWDVVRNRVEWSEMAYEIYTPDRHPADPGFEDFKTSLHPDDLEMVVAAIQSAFERDTPFDLDHRVVSVSQGVRTVHAYGKVFRDADGKPVRMVGTVQDITERKLSEIKLQENFTRITELNGYLERNARELEEQATELEVSKQQLQQTEAWYRSILHSAPDGMLVVDSSGLIMQVNAQLEKMFGYGEGELPGCHIEVLLQESLRENHIGLRNGFIASGDRGQRMAGSAKNLYGCRKDGSVFPVDISLSRLPDLDGRAGAICAAVRDVTERQKMDEAREGALSEALRLAQLRSAFMAQMSHELRTPLNGILGYAQNLLLGGSLGEKQLAGLHIIRQSGEHLLSLINGILDHAAIEAGKFELVPDDIELESFLAAIIGIIRIRAEQKNISFTCEAAADLPAVVCGDAQRLRQVLLNILSNAVKFTDSGYVVMRVGRIAPSRICFEVRDSGVGIAADQLENIFLPFEQIGEIGRRAGGSGLGLAISRKLVRLMGGEIRVESQPGAGSVFSFEIDMEAVQSGADKINAVALAELAVTHVAQAMPNQLVPPRHELDILYDAAMRGSMRDVMRYADHLADVDGRYEPFAGQLRQLAKHFQTKALIGLIAQYRNEDGGGNGV